MFLENLNYITMVIAAVAGLIVGFIWYSPYVLGTRWMKARGLSEGADDTARAAWYSYLIMAIGALVTAFVLSTLFNSLVVVGLGGIFLTALLVWIGFSVPMKLGDLAFAREPLPAFLISIGHQLVVTLVMAFIIAFFG